MIPNKGDRVRVWKAVMGREYSAEGLVEELRYDRSRGGEYLMFVQGDWWEATNDIENRYEIIQPADAVCRQCGETGVEMTPVDVPVNYGEDGEPDDGGCFVEHRTEWQCKDGKTCRQNRREMWALSQTVARFRDQEAAEGGAFGIGAGVGGPECA